MAAAIDMTLYWTLFGVLGAAILVLLYGQASGSAGRIVPSAGANVAAFLRLRNNYVFVYALMMAGDWLQGPYVYALYEHYGYTVKDIGRLFIAGFGSSMVLGTVVGSLADKHGRKKAALLYVVTYSLSCATKHWPDYWVLMFGRLLGGVATSLLFSAFEAWLVAEHFGRGFDGKWVGDTFSKAVFVGNGLMAILAGLAASWLVEGLKLGPVAPFDASAAVLLLGGAVIWGTWAENYGDAQHQKSLQQQFRLAASAIASDQRVMLLGAMQSLFEASMYTFVFLWTPALSSNGEKIPHGMIFACFMAASMVGSAASGTLMRRGKPESYMKYVFGGSAVALAMPLLVHGLGLGKTSAQDGVELVAGTDAAAALPPGMLPLTGVLQLVAFCAFEVLVGVFWPSMMTMRAAYVPEELRSTIMNVFRVPLNLFVCVILYNVHLFPLPAMFGLCSVFLSVATAAMLRLERLATQHQPLIRGVPEVDDLLLGGGGVAGGGGGPSGGATGTVSKI